MYNVLNQQVFGDKEFLQAAVDAGEVVWKRGLLKRVGICHGISGNAYVFLSLYRLTGNVEHLYLKRGPKHLLPSCLIEYKNLYQNERCRVVIVPTHTLRVLEEWHGRTILGEIPWL